MNYDHWYCTAHRNQVQLTVIASFTVTLAMLCLVLKYISGVGYAMARLKYLVWALWLLCEVSGVRDAMARLKFLVLAMLWLV